jgi:hypothetical protein
MGAVSFNGAFVGLDAVPFGMLWRQRFDAVESKRHLEIDWLLRPQSAVIIEGSDALGRFYVNCGSLPRNAFNAPDNRLLAAPSFYEGKVSRCARAKQAGSQAKAAAVAAASIKPRVLGVILNSAYSPVDDLVPPSFLHLLQHLTNVETCRLLTLREVTETL